MSRGEWAQQPAGKTSAWHGPGPVGHLEQRTFGAGGAAAATGAGFVINAPKNLMLAALGPGGTGPLPLPFLVPVPAAFFLMDVEPAGRPPPPRVALVPDMAGVEAPRSRRAARDTKKRRRSFRPIQRTRRGPSVANLKTHHDSVFRIEIG